MGLFFCGDREPGVGAASRRGSIKARFRLPLSRFYTKYKLFDGNASRVVGARVRPARSSSHLNGPANLVDKLEVLAARVKWSLVTGERHRRGLISGRRSRVCHRRAPAHIPRVAVAQPATPTRLRLIIPPRAVRLALHVPLYEGEVCAREVCVSC